MRAIIALIKQVIMELFHYNWKEYTEENKDDSSGTHTDLENIELKLNNNLLLLSSSIDHFLV